MILLVAVAVSFVWLAILSWVVYRTKNHYDNLIQTGKKESLTSILNTLLEEDRILSREVKDIRREIDALEDDSRFYFQAIKVVRYNPFEKRGREQSFVLAFLDKEKNGIVMNFMYTPDGLRVFTKKVAGGKGQDLELSEEEKKALDK